ncbi:cytochrome P450 [Polychytrium aggregatum]|uniref:cytochrome P450 n=1 Tax=Polychytrium aggregatum TaxID=110093 RepID=UPI0022FEF33D|nr:cytochrome P450 [Polychytrium aggregatum]KAI9209887.1 cytochrome P450 [Polychytrium aggregatum]
MTLVLARATLIAAGTIATVLSTRYLIYLIKSFSSPLRKLPGASDSIARVLLGSLNFFVFGADKIHEVSYKKHKKYGPIVVIGANEISIADPELAKAILVTDSFPKSSDRLGRLRDPVEPPSLIAIADDNEHRKLRRTMAYSFSVKGLASQEPLMMNCLNNAISYVDQKWAKETSNNPDEFSVLDIWQLPNRFALDVIGETAFGQTFHMIENGAHPLPLAIGRNLRHLSFRFLFPWTRYLPFLSINRQFTKDRNFMRSFTKDMVESRRSHPTDRHDILQQLLDAKDPETGKPLTDAEISINSRLFLIAGSETTANTIALTIIHLFEYPQVKAKLLEELDAAELDPRTNLIDHNVAKNLPYLNAVISEIMRFCPTIPQGPTRELPQDMYLGGYFVPKGTAVVIATFSTHRNKDIWSDPDTFRPERFLEDNTTFRGLESKCELVPFSAGPRNCIGKNFALMELRIFLANFLRSYDIEDISGQSKETRLMVTMRIKGDSYKVRIRPRQRTVTPTPAS